MGQSTQLFVTAETDPTAFGGARRHRIGRHHHWRYGPNMVICAAQVVEHLNTVGTGTRYLSTSETAEGVAAIYGVNRATGETSGLSIYDDVSTATAAECANNNGAFLVNLTPDGYSIGFLIGSEQDGDLTTVTGVGVGCGGVRWGGAGCGGVVTALFVVWDLKMTTCACIYEYMCWF